MSKGEGDTDPVAEAAATRRRSGQVDGKRTWLEGNQHGGPADVDDCPLCDQPVEPRGIPYHMRSGSCEAVNDD